jgi:hypothetical protein
MTDGQTTNYKHTHKAKDRVTRTPLMSAALRETRLLALSRCLGSLLVFCGVCGAHLLCFLCYLISFVSLHYVSCVPKVASFPGLSIHDFPSIFSNVHWSPFLSEYSWVSLMMGHDKISYYISKMVYKGFKFRIFTY